MNCVSCKNMCLLNFTRRESSLLIIFTDFANEVFILQTIYYHYHHNPIDISSKQIQQCRSLWIVVSPSPAWFCPAPVSLKEFVLALRLWLPRRQPQAVPPFLNMSRKVVRQKYHQLQSTTTKILRIVVHNNYWS